MLIECRKSCDPTCNGGNAMKKENGKADRRAAKEAKLGKTKVNPMPTDASWENEDLELALPGSKVLDVGEADLPVIASIELAANNTPTVVWFYAPWCKQCKIARPGFEAAALASKSNGENAVYARLDCVKYPKAKKLYGVNSYPAFKVLRGERHRWIEMGRTRSEETIGAAVANEMRGPFTWVDSEASLRAALFEQSNAKPGEHAMESIGQGEALALAFLPDGDDASAQALSAYTNLTSGCSVRLSPLPFVAIRDGGLLPKLGLPAIPPNHVAVIKLYTEPDAAPASQKVSPRLVSRPLVAPGAAAGEGAAAAAEAEAEAEAAMCQWVLGHRLPLLLDFEEDPYWGKRAGNFGFIALHALLFLSPPHKGLASVVRKAASRFERGQLVIMTFMVDGMDLSGNVMAGRYGVTSVLDTPKLVFLDQRLESENRQVKYTRPLDEANLVAFLRERGMRETAGGGGDEGDEGAEGKDEL